MINFLLQPDTTTMSNEMCLSVDRLSGNKRQDPQHVWGQTDVVLAWTETMD